MTRTNEVILKERDRPFGLHAVRGGPPAAPVFDDFDEQHPTIKYHRGAAFEASATRMGHAFVASASILEEDGHSTSLGKLGAFANEAGALGFAVRCATAFIDGDEMPLPPFQTTAQ